MSRQRLQAEWRGGDRDFEEFASLCSATLGDTGIGGRASRRIGLSEHGAESSTER